MGPVTQDTCTASKWTARPEIKAVNSLVMCGMVHDQAVHSIVMCGTVHGQRGASEAATERSDGDGERGIGYMVKKPCKGRKIVALCLTRHRIIPEITL